MFARWAPRNAGAARRGEFAWRSLRAAAALTTALLVVAASATAGAQDDAQQKAAAEALFDEGRRLLESGDNGAACQRFEQSQSIDPGVGTLLYLADCYERLGRRASAWATFREASSAARASGQADRSRIADERARKLEPRLSRIALIVPEANRSPGFELLLDGRLISSALFGVPFPVDAGKHRVDARAPGMMPWSSAIEIPEDGDRSSIQIPALMKQPATPAAATPAAAAPGAVASAATAEDDGAGDDARLIGIVAGSAGLAAITAGVIFGVRASDKDSEAEAGCTGGSCFTQTGAKLNDDARSSALIANVSYGIGLAGLAAGAFLYFTASSGDDASSSAPGLVVSPLVGDVRGLSVSTEF